MLIDQSYFTGPLTIAQLGQPSVVEDLNNFINKWEPIIMEAALGYDFYQAFLAGLDVDSDDVPEQRWLDLLNGVAFTNQTGRKTRWVGFAGGLNTQVVVASQRDDLTIYAGVTAGFPAGGRTYTNTTLNGWNYTLERFGAGTIEPEVEWIEIAGGGWTLTDDQYVLQDQERYIIHFTGKKIQTVQTGLRAFLSPLAGFIYFEYMKDLAAQTTGIGVVKNQGEHSFSVSPAQKMVDAYNDAVRQMMVLAELLRVDQNKAVDQRIYPEFVPTQVGSYYNIFDYGYGLWYNTDMEAGYVFRPINTFGI